MNKGKRKRPWQDREYLQHKCIVFSNMPKERFGKRFLKLAQDIMAIREQLYFYNFPEASRRGAECFDAFIKELRKLNDQT